MIEFKHLIFYYEHDLQFVAKNGKIYILDFLTKESVGCDFYGKVGAIKDIKPILRPLSDLFKTKENGKCMFDLYLLYNHSNIYFERAFISDLKEIVKENKLLLIPYSLILFLAKNHFDIFGLIESGLAIDKNTNE